MKMPTVPVMFAIVLENMVRTLRDGKEPEGSDVALAEAMVSIHKAEIDHARTLPLHQYEDHVAAL